MGIQYAAFAQVLGGMDPAVRRRPTCGHPPDSFRIPRTSFVQSRPAPRRPPRAARRRHRAIAPRTSSSASSTSERSTCARYHPARSSARTRASRASAAQRGGQAPGSRASACSSRSTCDRPRRRPPRVAPPPPRPPRIELERLLAAPGVPGRDRRDGRERVGARSAPSRGYVGTRAASPRPCPARPAPPLIPRPAARRRGKRRGLAAHAPGRDAEQRRDGRGRHASSAGERRRAGAGASRRRGAGATRVDWQREGRAARICVAASGESRPWTPGRRVSYARRSVSRASAPAVAVRSAARRARPAVEITACTAAHGTSGRMSGGAGVLRRQRSTSVSCPSPPEGVRAGQHRIGDERQRVDALRASIGSPASCSGLMNSGSRHDPCA